MNIDSIGGLLKIPTKVEVPFKEKGPEFDNIFTDIIKQADSSQKASDQMIEDFSAGKNVEIQDVMIAGEKAKTNFELLLEIRNKTVDMYKELTRIQI